jgi:DNA primase
MAASSFRDSVEAIRRAADIVDVVGDVVQLRRTGQSLSGLCPFHQEKTPSFNVSPAKQVYYCYGCGAGGDVFKFLMELHGVGFVEAAQLLAERYGLPRPTSAGPREAGAERRRRRVLEVLEQAQRTFAEQLFGPEGAGAREYLARRGVTLELARRYGLGLARNGWDSLLRTLAQRSFDVGELVEAGLAVPRPAGGGAYDRFRGRITFPIRDSAGRVVSFGGRALGEGEPKYLNGPETPVYDKSRVLFRMAEVGAEIRRSGRAVLVEGYFDAVGLAAAGVEGVVAVCGTAVGDGHAALLRRATETVVLLFDGDDAGRRAVHRALGPLLAAGLSVRVARPPAGQDPDDLAREAGPEAVRALLGDAQELTDFIVDEARQHHDLATLDGKLAAVKMALGHIGRLESPLARAEASSRVAAGLGIEDGQVREELQRAARARRRELRGSRLAAASPAEGRFTAAERILLRFLGDSSYKGSDSAAAGRLLEALPLEELGGGVRELVRCLAEGLARGESWDLRRLADTAPAEVRAELFRLAVADEPEPTEAEAWGCVQALRERRLRRRLVEVQKAIESAEGGPDLDALMREKLALAREMHGLGGGQAL